METNALRLELRDPRSPEAAGLIALLSRELAERYDSANDGSGDFQPEDIDGPGAAFVVGLRQGEPVACGAYRPMEEGVAEIKRMFVAPEHRGRGYSKQLLAELERRARLDGYHALRLETGVRQPEAIHLYEGAGYERVPNYGKYAGQPLSVCFEKKLPLRRAPGHL